MQNSTDMYYDDIATGYDALYGDEQKEKLLAAKKNLIFEIQKSDNLLDVGCGTGLSTDFWNDEFGCDTTGIDPAQKLIEQNKNKKSKLIQGFAEKLPFEDNSFDIVVSFSAIQNFSDVKKGLEEIKRVGNQKFILSVMCKGQNYPHIHTLIQEIFGIKEGIRVKNDVMYVFADKSKL